MFNRFMAVNHESVKLGLTASQFFHSSSTSHPLLQKITQKTQTIRATALAAGIPISSNTAAEKVMLLRLSGRGVKRR